MFDFFFNYWSKLREKYLEQYLFPFNSRFFHDRQIMTSNFLLNDFFSKTSTHSLSYEILNLIENCTFKWCMVIGFVQICIFKWCMVFCTFKWCLVICTFKWRMVICTFKLCLVICTFKWRMVICTFKWCLVMCTFKWCMVIGFAQICTFKRFMVFVPLNDVW